MSYTVLDYGSMIADGVRTNAYAKALRRVIKPDSVVLDIGTGTGIFALLACRFGARQIYAVEPEDIIQVASEIAAANGCAERIEFIQEVSTEVRLSDRVDVIVSDIHGRLPLFKSLVPTIIDARERLLAPGGQLIPQRDTLWAAIVEETDLYKQFVEPWDNQPFGWDMQAAKRLSVNSWGGAALAAENLLVKPQRLATLDYSSIEHSGFSAELTWNARRAGTAHGLAVWFDSVLTEGVSFSNAPSAPKTIFGQGFFPWSKPVPLDLGDTVSVSLRADLIGDEHIWRWDTRVLDPGDSKQIRADFRQSTFFGAPLSKQHLDKRAASHVPTLGKIGQVDRFILESMDGETSAGDIAHSVRERFPGRFAKWEEAVAYVCEISQKYSR